MANSSPVLSVVIPCRNEVKHIDQCLTSLVKNQTLREPYEVLIVDGLSDDGTLDILAEWSRNNPNVRVLQNRDRIENIAMNIGIQAAKGQWIVRADAHSTFPADYLELCLETSRRTGAENVGGRVVTQPWDDSAQAQLVRAVVTHRFGVGNSEFRVNEHMKEGPAETVPFGCFRRDLFKRIGYYDYRLARNEDTEFNSRLVRAGGQIWCNPAIHFTYYSRGTVARLQRQAYDNGRFNMWMWSIAPHAFVPRHAIPGVFLFSLVCACLLLMLTPLGWAALAAILLPYGLLAILSSIQQSRRYGWWMLPRLPMVFFLYHVSYGFGIWSGFFALLAGTSPVQRKQPSIVGPGLADPNGSADA